MDTNGDKRVDTRFLTAMENVEALRIDPTASRKDLDATKKLVEGWTNLP